MKKAILAVCNMLVAITVLSQNIETEFEVLLKNEVIGKIVATETITGTTLIRDIRSITNAKVLAFSIHVESDTKITKGDEIMTEGVAYRHANRGAEDIHAITKRVANKKYERNRNDKKTVLENTDIIFCIADLYFKEPKGLSRIYSNMWAEMVEIKSLGNGIYQVITPDKKKSSYTYKNSKLISIEVDTPAGKVTSRRKS